MPPIMRTSAVKKKGLLLGVPVIDKVRATLAQRADLLTTSEEAKVVLVARGKFNPIHRMHLRRLVMARQYLEEHTRFRVLGGLVIPKHAAEVRQSLRTRPRDIIPPRHRLGMLRCAVGASAWIAVDPYDITRRRALDYLSTLDHVRSLFDSDTVRIMLLVAPLELLTLNLEELREAGHECITICRPQEHERLVAQLGSRWSQIAHVVEDSALLSADLEKTTTAHIRRDMTATTNPTVASMLPRAVRDYISRHKIADKMAGTIAWTKYDKSLADGQDEQDRGYIRHPKKFDYESTTYIKHR